MTTKYSGNTSSVIKDYKFDPSATYRIDGIKVVYTRGVFHTLTGVFGFYEQDVDQNNVEILIESCINANCDKYSNTPFWMNLKEYKDCGYTVACEYCDKLLGTYRPR
jgi:hypothetical protein